MVISLLSTVESMSHLIEPFGPMPLKTSLEKLIKAHHFLVERAQNSVSDIKGIPIETWGIDTKRISVKLEGENPPDLIGKTEEKLSEVINMTATLERLIAAIDWFGSKYPSLSILKCHPSTSHGENDLVFEDGNQKIVALCEVCDVVSKNADSNKKEKKDLANLKCGKEELSDGVERYICTSKEFAETLIGKRRRWDTKHYRYDQFSIDGGDTVLLLVKPA